MLTFNLDRLSDASTSKPVVGFSTCYLSVKNQYCVQSHQFCTVVPSSHAHFNFTYEGWLQPRLQIGTVIQT